MEKLHISENGQWQLNKVLLNSISPADAEVKNPEADRRNISVVNKQLPNGLIYKQFKVRGNNSNARIHTLYEKNNPEPVSIMNTSDSQDVGNDKIYKNTVNWASTIPEHQKKGLGRQLYLAALMHLGTIHSDDNISPHIHKLWGSLSKIPGLSVRLSAGDSELHRHRAELDPSKKLDLNSLFHSINL